MKNNSLLSIAVSLATLFALVPSLPGAADTRADAQALANRANQAMVEENWEEANRLLDRALELAADAPELWVGSAFTLIRLDKVDAARERYETALELYLQRVEADPESVGMIMNVGYTLVLLNRRDEAIEYLHAAAERNPDQLMFRSFEEIVEGLEANFSEFIVPKVEANEATVEEPDEAATEEPEASSQTP